MSQRVGYAVIAAIVLIPGIGLSVGNDPPGPGEAIIVVTALAYWIFALRPRLALTATGVRITNYLRTVDLAAADVEWVSLSDRRSRAESRRGGQPLFIWDRNGPDLKVMAVRDSVVDDLLRRPPRRDSVKQALEQHLAALGWSASDLAAASQDGPRSRLSQR